MNPSLKSDIKFIHFCEPEKDGLKDCHIKATDKKTNKQIGFVYYFYDVREKSIWIERIEVEENYRRKGIATNMMKTLEKNTDAKTIDFELSENGERFFNTYYETRDEKGRFV